MMGSGVRVPSAAPVTYWNTRTKWPPFGAAICFGKVMEPRRNHIQNRVHGDFNHGKVRLLHYSPTGCSHRICIPTRNGRMVSRVWPEPVAVSPQPPSSRSRCGLSLTARIAPNLIPGSAFPVGNKGNTGNSLVLLAILLFPNPERHGEHRGTSLEEAFPKISNWVISCTKHPALVPQRVQKSGTTPRVWCPLAVEGGDAAG